MSQLSFCHHFLKVISSHKPRFSRKLFRNKQWIILCLAVLSHPYHYLLVVTTSSTGWSPIPSWITDRHITTANGRDIFAYQPPNSAALLNKGKMSGRRISTRRCQMSKMDNFSWTTLQPTGGVPQCRQQTVGVWIHRESRRKGRQIVDCYEKRSIQMTVTEPESAKMTALEKTTRGETSQLFTFLIMKRKQDFTQWLPSTSEPDWGK